MPATLNGRLEGSAQVKGMALHTAGRVGRKGLSQPAVDTDTDTQEICCNWDRNISQGTAKRNLTDVVVHSIGKKKIRRRFGPRGSPAHVILDTFLSLGSALSTVLVHSFFQFRVYKGTMDSLQNGKK